MGPSASWRCSAARRALARCIGSLFELKDAPAGPDVDLRSDRAGDGEVAMDPNGPRQGMVVYSAIYGPEAPAFDSSWKPGDFEKVG